MSLTFRSSSILMTLGHALCVLTLVLAELYAVRGAPVTAEGLTSTLTEELETLELGTRELGTRVVRDVSSVTMEIASADKQEFCTMRDKAKTLFTSSAAVASAYLEARFSDDLTKQNLEDTSTSFLPEFTTRLEEDNTLSADNTITEFLQRNEFKLHLVFEHLMLVIHSEADIPLSDFTSQIDSDILNYVIRTRIHCQRWLAHLDSAPSGESVYISDQVRSPTAKHIIEQRNYVILRDVRNLAEQMHKELLAGIETLGTTCAVNE